MGARNPDRDTIWKLGSLADSGYVLHVTCGKCHHSAFVQVIPLAVRLGPDTGMHQALYRMKCERCGQTGPTAVPVKWDRMLPKGDDRWINGP